jgi:hypothetical protein
MTNVRYEALASAAALEFGASRSHATGSHLFHKWPIFNGRLANKHLVLTNRRYSLLALVIGAKWMLFRLSQCLSLRAMASRRSSSAL